MILAWRVTGIGALAVPMTDMLPMTWRAPWVLASFTIAYSGLSLYYVNSGPYLLKATREEARGNVFAFQSALNSIASFVGGLIGGLMPALFAGILGVTMTQPAPTGLPLLLVGVIVLSRPGCRPADA